MEDENVILLSWISEWAYCKRRFYLQVQEHNYIENQYTIEGSIEHERAHTNDVEKRGNKIIIRGLPVSSEKYHLYGICDVVEFEKDETNGAFIPFLGCNCNIIPVEYKHGRTRDEREYNLQMAAQVLCLEEMFGHIIPYGYLYYVESNERFKQVMDKTIRNDLITTISEIMDYIQNPTTIKPELRRRCNGCSIKDLCSPKKILVQEYMNEMVQKYIIRGDSK